MEVITLSLKLYSVPPQFPWSSFGIVVQSTGSIEEDTTLRLRKESFV